LGAALVCGALIGLDREIKHRAAGLRTHMLVALAACLFTILSFEIVAQVDIESGARGADPVRIVEALTAGVAFLAAGAIVLTRGGVRGLTTGASLWLTGAMGLAAGLGLYWLAYIATAAALAVLILMQQAKSLVGVDDDEESDGESKKPNDR